MIFHGNADGEEDEAEELDYVIQAFDDSEIKLITSNLAYNELVNNTFNIAVQLDFLTGLRIGELLGLKKKFVFSNMVKVRNTLKRIKVFDTPSTWHYQVKLIKPKFSSSIRDIYYANLFYKNIEKYFKEQETKWKANGLKFSDDSLIFTTASCQPIDRTNFTRAWKRFLKRINIEYKKFHSIRDTYATSLIRRGAKIMTVKELLGHSSISVTEKYYLYVFPEDKSETAELLNDIVS